MLGLSLPYGFTTIFHNVWYDENGVLLCTEHFICVLNQSLQLRIKGKGFSLKDIDHASRRIVSSIWFHNQILYFVVGVLLSTECCICLLLEPECTAQSKGLSLKDIDHASRRIVSSIQFCAKI